jgi:hypothetical protein
MRLWNSIILARDFIAAIFHGEVPRVQPMHLGFRKILQRFLAAFAGEENIVPLPEDDGFRLTLAQERLPLRVERDVGAVIIKEIQLDLLGAE